MCSHKVLQSIVGISKSKWRATLKFLYSTVMWKATMSYFCVQYFLPEMQNIDLCLMRQAENYPCYLFKHALLGLSFWKEDFSHGIFMFKWFYVKITKFTYSVTQRKRYTTHAHIYFSVLHYCKSSVIDLVLFIGYSWIFEKQEARSY